jgi:hypothetical protein
MKKILLTLSFIAVANYPCFAQQPITRINNTSPQSVITPAAITPTKTSSATTNTEQTFVGTFESFTPTTKLVRSLIPFVGLKNLIENRNVSGKIVVVADNGSKAAFYLMSTTNITKANGQRPYMVPKRGTNLEVKYSTITNGSKLTNGQNGAISVHYLD